MAAKKSLPPALAANAARMKAGKPLVKSSGATVPAKNTARRQSGKKGK